MDKRLIALLAVLGLLHEGSKKVSESIASSLENIDIYSRSNISYWRIASRVDLLRCGFWRKRRNSGLP